MTMLRFTSIGSTGLFSCRCLWATMVFGASLNFNACLTVTLSHIDIDVLFPSVSLNPNVLRLFDSVRGLRSAVSLGTDS